MCGQRSNKCGMHNVINLGFVSVWIMTKQSDSLKMLSIPLKHEYPLPPPCLGRPRVVYTRSQRSGPPYPASKRLVEAGTGTGGSREPGTGGGYRVRGVPGGVGQRAGRRVREGSPISSSRYDEKTKREMFE